MGTYDVSPVGRQAIDRPSRRSICATISMLVTVLILGVGLQADAQSATIDFSGANRNWITGLGGGVVYLYGPNFKTPMSQAMADDLFCTGDGQLGLSLLRISIDPGGETAVPIMQGSPYGDGYGWAPEVGVAQLAQSEAASCASPGQVSVFATPWSVLCNPTTCYKTNGSVDGGYLNTSDYSNFAGWLEDFVQYAQSQSVNLTAVSLQNEPDVATTTPEFGYTYWTAAEFDNWFDDSGVESDIANDPYHTEIMFPEVESYSDNLYDTTLHDSTASKYVGIDAGHCYGYPEAPPALDYYATNLGIPEWVTECDQNETSKTAQTWQNAVDLARSVNAWMNAGYNAWGAWEIEDGGPTWPNPYWNTDSGFIYPNSSGDPVIEMKGYAMGQYSKYVRPGYMNVSVPTEAYVEVSAYQGAGNYVIVAINNHTDPENTTFTIENATISSMNVYQSDAPSTTATSCGTQCLVAGSPSTVTPTSCSSNLCFTYDMPAYSIVTFVGTGTGTANTITNPRFATGDLAGWAVAVTSGDGSVADAYVKKDTSCCSDYYELEEKGTSFKGWARNIVDVPGNDNFTYTVQARSNGSHGYVELLEVGGSTDLCKEMDISGTSWTQYTCSGTMPNSGSKQLLIRLASSGLTSGEYVDYGASNLTISAP